MSRILKTMKNHKTLSFMALGGTAVAGLMHSGLVNDFLPIPQLGVAIGGYAIGRILHHKNVENGLFKKNIKKSTFLTLGAFGAMAAVQALEFPNTGIVQLTLGTLASYGMHGLLSSLKSSSVNTQQSEENTKFKMPEKNKAQAAVNKMREKPVSEDVEFQPLNFR